MRSVPEMATVPKGRAVLARAALVILAASAILVSACKDDPYAPTQPHSEVTSIPGLPPPASGVPMVTSAEPTRNYYPRAGWIIRGKNLFPDPVATFEAGASVFEMSVQESVFNGTRVGIVVPGNVPPGPYTPCVRTPSGKGCGNFSVTVN
ncbi:MAG: hypothetical protein ABI592_02130 [Acidobacteriota bacterium]